MRRILFICIFVLASSLYAEEKKEEELSWYGKWKQWMYMTGNWCGARDWLEDHGVELRFGFKNVVGKVFHGGHKKGRTFPFMFTFGTALHSDGLGLWKGATLFAGGEWRHDFGKHTTLTSDYAGAFQTLNDLDDTEQYIQLAEYWFEQRFLDRRIGFRIGRHYATDLFLTQKVAGEFINTSFQAIPTVPLARYRTGDEHFSAFKSSPTRKQPAPSIGFAAWWQVVDWFKISAGIYDQRPEPETPWFSETEKDRKNISVVTELLFSPRSYPGKGVKSEYRFGIWYVNKTDYSDKAEEDIHPHAKKFNGTGGPFLSVDQILFKENDIKDDEQGLWMFGQFGFAPGRWETMLYYGGGLLYRGPVPSRDRDTTGIAFGISDFSEKMEGKKDADTGEYVPTYSMENIETVFEWFYKIQAGNWLSVHHGLQWVRIPKGIADPSDKYYEKDAFVFNVRGEFVF